MVEDLFKSLDISQRGDAATAISYEADALVLDPPVYGRVGYIPILVQEIQQAWINLDNIKKQFAEANIKVSSTETGVIFVNIVHETSNVDEGMVIVLNDIHIDIMDYISPASCADVAFRTMWGEFEWENKVAVNTVIQDEKEFLYHIVKSTNMKCLSPPSALEGECGFLAANLYAKSVFGEDALVNLSIEKQGDGKLSGYIRIRSKTQGIALSLGDKITLKQKGGGSN